MRVARLTGIADAERQHRIDTLNALARQQELPRLLNINLAPPDPGAPE